MRPNLLHWQWSLYGDNHTTRATLVVHVLTVPLFQLATLVVLAAPFQMWGTSVMVGTLQLFGGLATMALVMAAQGIVHRAEAKPPVPFEGPLDVLSRIVLEQWITFPRFVLSGGLARAWRDARVHGDPEAANERTGG
ncbi:MAG: terminase [Deltaproteobacteria bacterium]|nr:terminase [Deltaproteobacteria bacterium]